jgi:hypothetical protein
MHYLFSIKNFRKIIFQKFSYKEKLFLKEVSSDDNNNNHKSGASNPTLYTRKKKINYLLNENNESYFFFYTDKNFRNSNIEFHSYCLYIDYEELNPKRLWKFCLNFRQMRSFLKINKFELLEIFLPKLMKTNFECGNLEMDFSLLEDFNTNILNYQKKEILNKYIHSSESLSDRPKKENIKIIIKKPYTITEKMEGMDFIKSQETELSENVLDSLRKKHNYISWIKIIIKEMDSNDNDLDENEEFS